MLFQWDLIFFRHTHTECWGVGTDITSLKQDIVVEPSTHIIAAALLQQSSRVGKIPWRRIRLSKLMGIFFFNVNEYKLHRNSS